MNIHRLTRLTNCQRRMLKNVLCIGCLMLSFFMGNFIGLMSSDTRYCDVELCSEILKQGKIEDLGEWNIVASNIHKKSVFLVVLIVSAPENYQLRNTIRQTWISKRSSDTLHYFVIGVNGLSPQLNTTVFQEHKINGDILALSMQDSYALLTKKLLASLVYLHQNVNFRFLLKCDDDSYVNLSQLHLELKNVPHKQHLHWGFFDGRAKPKTKGQWEETEWLLCDHYLPYALGGGYIISSDLVNFIGQNAKYLKMYKSEDISLAVWLAPLQLNRVHDPRFDTEYKSRGCNNKYLVSHKQTPILMKEKYNSIQQTGHLCTNEFKVRNSYNYNWKVPPSKCCFRNDSSVP